MSDAPLPHCCRTILLTEGAILCHCHVGDIPPFPGAEKSRVTRVDAIKKTNTYCERYFVPSNAGGMKMPVILMDSFTRNQNPEEERERT
jgi:hypothetical protein